ncbi:porin [Paraburkholderia sp.]|uniref:porin n=1 Tax=Paraburkholderia sp. TaxID=1926495 RepID=UPI0039E23543
MKKICSVAFATYAGMVTTVNAQSSVTLYGIVDNGINYLSNVGGHRSYAMGGGVGSRFGFQGVEDLGDGNKAILLLENGFDPNSGKLGQGGLLFGRQAYFGLSSPYGKVTLGRQYDVKMDFVGPFEFGSQWAGSLAAHPGDLDSMNRSFRANNSIKFDSVSYDGLSFGVQYGLGGVAGDVSRNQTFSLGAGYANGPLTLGVGYLNVRNANVSFFGNGTSGTPQATVANNSSPVFSGFLSAHTYQVVSAGGAYRLGKATLGTTYSNISFRGLGDLSSGPNPIHYSGNVSFNNAELNIQYQLIPTLIVGAEYDYTKAGKVSMLAGRGGGATYQVVAAGLDYLLSKRTDAYVLAEYQKASGTNSLNLPAVAAINTETASGSDRQTLIHLGIRHKF